MSEFKVTVFSLYQVLPDVIINITPHAVMVTHYYNGWLERLAQLFVLHYLISLTCLLCC
jgi:hypothetical protein